MDTRPTTDKIKETLFNMLQADIPGSYFLDLFAGSGQIGLEAISRGALYSVFVENNKKAAGCIEENIAFTRFGEKSRLMVNDVLSALRMMEGRYSFDIIFMDPPYGRNLEHQALACLSESSLLKPDGQIIVEASLDTGFDYLDELGFEVLKYKRYRNNMHVFIGKQEKSYEKSDLSGKF